jgi:hypothetical protein
MTIAAAGGLGYRFGIDRLVESEERERLAVAAAALAGRAGEAEVRAQLHALAGLIRNLDRPAVDAATRAAQEAELDAAIDRGDEAAAIAVMRRLAAAERSTVRPVDWLGASGG